MARSTWERRFSWASAKIRWTVDGAIPSRQANWTGPSRNRRRSWMQRFVVFGLVLFGEW